MSFGQPELLYNAMPWTNSIVHYAADVQETSESGQGSNICGCLEKPVLIYDLPWLTVPSEVKPEYARNPWEVNLFLRAITGK